MRNLLIKILATVLLVFVILPSVAKDPKREFYSLIIYRIKNKVQEESVGSFLKHHYLPAMHKPVKKT